MNFRLILVATTLQLTLILGCGQSDSLSPKVEMKNGGTFPATNAPQEDEKDRIEASMIEVTAEITEVFPSGYRVKYEDGKFDVEDVVVLQIESPEDIRNSKISLRVPLATKVKLSKMSSCKFSINPNDLEDAINTDQASWFGIVKSFRTFE